MYRCALHQLYVRMLGANNFMSSEYSENNICIYKRRDEKKEKKKGKLKHKKGLVSNVNNCS